MIFHHLIKGSSDCKRHVCLVGSRSGRLLVDLPPFCLELSSVDSFEELGLVFNNFWQSSSTASYIKILTNAYADITFFQYGSEIRHVFFLQQKITTPIFSFAYYLELFDFSGHRKLFHNLYIG